MISVLGMFFLALAIYWLQSEPTYHGRHLSSWLAGFEAESMQTRQQAADAVRSMGSNAVPYLVSQLRRPPIRQEPSWKQKLNALLGKQSVVKITVPRGADKRLQALAGLDALGPVAKSAVPALEELLHQSPPDHRAVLVLADIGPAAIPALTRALTNDTKVIRQAAQVSLAMQQSHSEFLSPKTGEDAEFMRRSCEFNVKLLKASLDGYRAQHPELVMPDGRPVPSRPPDFFPRPSSRMSDTNHHPLRIQPGFE